MSLQNVAHYTIIKIVTLIDDFVRRARIERVDNRLDNDNDVESSHVLDMSSKINLTYDCN